MPVNITDTATWTDPIQTPDDGDAADEAIFALTPQGLANRTKYLRTYTPGASSVVSRLIPLASGRNDDTQDPGVQGAWLFGGAIWGKSGPQSTGTNLFFEPNLPIGVTVTQIRARYSGGGGHSGVPSGMPKFLFGYWDPSNSSSTVLATVTDASASAGAYDADHYITSGALSHVVVAARRYYIWLSPEGGTNALDGKGVIRGLDVSWTAP